MDSSVKARASHYEILGLTPAATASEVAQAFASKMSLFAARPMAAVAELSVAYETLRDPARRRAYDASLRPAPPAQPRFTARWNSAPFIGSALEAMLVEERLPAVQQSEARSRPEVHAQADARPLVDSRKTDPRSSARKIFPNSAERPHEEPRTLVRGSETSSLLGRESAVEWSRTGIAIGGVVVFVAVLGAVAGWSSGLVEQPQQPEVRITTPLPPAKSPAPAGIERPSAGWSLETRRPERFRHAAVSVARAERTPPAPQAVAAEDPAIEPSQTGPIGSGPASAEEPDAEAVEASLPLPKPVIARTIARIGYPCGEVASATPIEGGAPGAFKVTCTSGHSYQAAPVRGRYHFRRLAGR